MGVTIHYHGQLADPSRIEDFEDRVLDLVLELGGQVQLWRTSASTGSERIVRGVIATIEPGQEPLWLVVSPEGKLLHFADLEDAEQHPIDGISYCSTKTQYGSPVGHVAIVELLRALKAEFIPDLHVSDEGDYWETGDLRNLAQKLGYLNRMIDSVAAGLESHPLNSEAAEDLDILATRIERVVRIAHQTISRPAEHPPVGPVADSPFVDAPWTETDWDEAFRANRRQQERIQRAVEERMQAGDSTEEALRAAFDAELGAFADDSPERWESEQGDEEEAEEEPTEAWQESAETPPEDSTFIHVERHPLLKRTTKLLVAAMRQLEDRESPAIDPFMQGLMDLNGGLAQALDDEEEVAEGWQDSDDDETDAGLIIVQLKRALRGAAFAKGSLYNLDDGLLAAETSKEFHAVLVEISSEIVERLREARKRMNGSSF